MKSFQDPKTFEEFKKLEIKGLKTNVWVFLITGIFILFVVIIKVKLNNLLNNHFLGLALLLNGMGSLLVSANSYKLEKKVRIINAINEFDPIKKSMYKSFLVFFCIPYLEGMNILAIKHDYRGSIIMLVLLVFTLLMVYFLDWKSYLKLKEKLN